MLSSKALAPLWTVTSLVQGASIFKDGIHGGGPEGSIKDHNLRSKMGLGNYTVYKHVETNPEGVFYRDPSAWLGMEHILRDDKEQETKTANPEVKLMTPSQLEEFHEAIRSYYDRPIDSTPISQGGTSFGHIDFTKLTKGDHTPAAQVKTSPNEVLCGGHWAATCAECPQGHGASWCNEDCYWDFNDQTCKSNFKMCDASGHVTAFKCEECSTECDSNDCERMPIIDGESTTNCRDVLGENTRSASLFLNYHVPSNIPRVVWWFHQLDILDTSTTTFYMTNGHKFGYAGFQIASTEPFDGRVIFSIWDQGDQVARTVACGTGVNCSNFGGEGTGRKSVVYSDNLPLMDEPYSIMMHAKHAGPFRMQYSVFFYVPENEMWDSSREEGSNYSPTRPGWRFLCTIEVGTDESESWWMMDLHSFLEQWEANDGMDRRAGLYGPSFVAGEEGDFVQLLDVWFQHGMSETYKHVNAWKDATGSIGMEMGSTVQKQAVENQEFQFDQASSLPDELDSFLGMKNCISDATSAEIESCLENQVPTSSCMVKKIKLETTTDVALVLREVSVFSSGVDVAVEGSASQSSTLRPDLNINRASLAIDNSQTTFSSTLSGSGQWWQVILREEVHVQSVQILNRRCGRRQNCTCNLSNVNINLYDNAGNLLVTRNLGNTCDSATITETFSSC